MAQRFVIWGAGGHGKVVADLVRATGGTVSGFVDDDPAKLGSAVGRSGDRVVMGSDALLAKIGQPAELRGFDAVAMAIGANGTRLRCLTRLGEFPAPALVHPSAVVSPSAVIGRATVVFAMAVVQADATLGEGCIVNTAAVVEHDCVLGEGVHLSPSATLAGNVRLAAGSWIGAGATVLPGVAVGAGAVVGGGALVHRDVADGQVVAGVPARPLRAPRAVADLDGIPST